MNLPTRIQVVVLLAALMSFAGLVAVADAQSLTPGAVSLSSTFEAVSVRARFSGDSNANATATIQFRKSGDTVWHDAYTAFIDRRVTLGGTPNQLVNEARVSIVGLTPNTSYDVLVTWSDPDGVSGSQPSVQTISTLTLSPPTGGSTITVSNDAQLSAALGGVAPGQTIHLTPGTYSPFAISRSGTASAFIVIEGDAALTSIVSGTGTPQNGANLTINANFLMIRQLLFGPADWNAIIVGNNRHDIYIQNNTIQAVSVLCAQGPTTSHYDDAGIYLGGSFGGTVSRIFIQNNSISAGPALNACVQSPAYDGPGSGVRVFNASTLVINNNTVTGAFRDAISADDDLYTENNDFSRNIAQDYVDDGIETKGQNVNVRVWANTVLATQANTCFAINTNDATARYGPQYVFRNTCRATKTLISGGGTAYKMGGSPTYIFHNSVDTTPSPSPGFDGFDNSEGGPASAEYTVLNNITRTNDSIVGNGVTGNTFDYNVSTTSGGWAWNWNGGASYQTFADWQSGTGQDAHSLNANPLFIDTALHIGATSPAVDKGVVIPNFNSADSAWPFAGVAPDIGAFESSSSSHQPTAPPSLIVH